MELIKRQELFNQGYRDAEEWYPYLPPDIPDSDAYTEGYTYASGGVCRYCNELVEHCEC